MVCIDLYWFIFSYCDVYRFICVYSDVYGCILIYIDVYRCILHYIDLYVFYAGCISFVTVRMCFIISVM